MSVSQTVSGAAIFYRTAFSSFDMFCVLVRGKEGGASVDSCKGQMRGTPLNFNLLSRVPVTIRCATEPQAEACQGTG